MQVRERGTSPLPQSSLLAMIGCFLLSTLLISSIRFAKVERVQGFVGGACSASLDLQQAIGLVTRILHCNNHLACNAVKLREKLFGRNRAIRSE